MMSRELKDMTGCRPSAAPLLSANWEADRTINGFSVPKRANIVATVIDPWPKLPDGKLDLTKAPMRLLGIVYRPDLRKPRLDRGGEGRFVFGVLDSNGSPLPFTVILEYDLAAQTEAEVQDWAAAFQNLSSLEFGEDFNTEIEARQYSSPVLFQGRALLGRRYRQ